MRTIAEMRDLDERDIKRITKLTAASAENGAEGQFLTGIRVAFDLTFTNKAWVEAERYRFLEFVSSQSTMHRLSKFNVREQYVKYVDPRVVDIMEELVAEYNNLVDNRPKDMNESDAIAYGNMLKDKYLGILYTNPSGFQLTARLTTNYRCLLNIFLQRHNHRLPEWREFCKKLLELPMFAAFVKAYMGEIPEIEI